MCLGNLLSDLGGDHDLFVIDYERHLEGRVDLGQRVRRELDVDDRPGDRHDPTVLEGGAPRARGLGCSGGHDRQAPFGPRSASAPLTISMISVVIES